MARRAKDAQSDFFPGFAEITEIGSGDLANVYRAREVATDRFVALKLLNVRDRSPRALESFDREAGALGPISSHPNIVTLFGSFRAADGRPVLVLELCRSAVADRLVNGAGLPVRDVVSIGIKISGALETAHRAGILHRDVKPQNMLVTEFGEPALADFGVALLKSSTQVTAGLFDFTTLHAAPELLEGGETSAATDVYELASSLYQLIAGRSAFRAFHGESPAAVILRILRDPVEPLDSARVPDALSALLLRAMAKQRVDRPATAAEFAARLAAIEDAQGWAPTNCVVRDVDGRRIDPADPGPRPVPHGGLPPVSSSAVPNDPDVTWVPPPDESREDPPEQAAPVSAPMAASPDDGWSTPSIVEHHGPQDAAGEQPAGSAGDSWSTPSLVTSQHEPGAGASAAERIEPDDDINATRRRPTNLPPPPPPQAPDPAQVPAPTSPPIEPTTSPPIEPTTSPPIEPTDEPSVEVTRRRPTTLPPAITPASSAITPAPPAPDAQPVDMPAPDPAVMNAHTTRRPAALVEQAPPPGFSPPPMTPPPGFAPPPPIPSPLVSQPPTAPPARPTPELTYQDLPPNSLWVPPDAEDGGRRPAPEFPPNVEMPTATGPVPTWVFRAPTESRGAGTDRPPGDLTLDPASLRNKVTIRSGAASLTIDEGRLVSRNWLGKTEIHWPSVRGFETRFDPASQTGKLVAHTDRGPVELPATKGSSADLRYVQALLDAYRQRAMSGH